MHTITPYLFHYVTYSKHRCRKILHSEKFCHLSKRIFITLFHFRLAGTTPILEPETTTMDNSAGKMFPLSVAFILIIPFVLALGGL